MNAAKQMAGRALLGACAVVCATLAPFAPAMAGDLMLEQLPASQTVRTPLDKTIALQARGPVGKVVVSQPETVEVGLAGPDQLYLIGRQLGSANLRVYGRDGRLSQTLDVQVGYDAEALRETLADALPDEKVAVTQLASGLLVEGEVATPAAETAVLALAERAAPGSVVSRLHVKSGVVRVDVRLVEVNASRLREVGARFSLDDGHVNLSGNDLPLGASDAHAKLGFNTRVGDYRLDAALRALEDKGDLRVVAEPTIVTISGEKGSFRAGGELPFPVPAEHNTVTVEFRPYGAGLTVQPTIQANGLVQIALDAELSDIDPMNKLVVSGSEVRALITRRATTTAELRDGQTVVIAGLFEQGANRQVRQTPWLGKIPIVGAAFRTAQGKETRRELAIIVTPHIGAEAPRALAAVADDAPRPPEPATMADPAPRTPKSVAAPRGPPPLRALAHGVRDVLRPPVRWMTSLARGVVRSFTGRA